MGRAACTRMKRALARLRACATCASRRTLTAVAVAMVVAFCTAAFVACRWEATNPPRILLKPQVTLRTGENIRPAGVLMLLTVHDKTISGKVNMYDRNGGRLNTYRREMEQAIQSIRHFSPRLPIAVMVDFDKEEHPEVFEWLMRTADFVMKQTIPSAKGASWGSKMPGLLLSPFERTLHIDTDTRVCDDITPMFRYLDNFDLAMTPDLPFYSTINQQQQSSKYPDLHHLGQMQGGMLLFRNNKAVKDLFRQIYWTQRHGGMQKYFDLFDKQEGVLGKHGRRIAFTQIPIEYNLRLNEPKKYPAFLHGKLKIVHSRGLIDKGHAFVQGGFDVESQPEQGRPNCTVASSSAGHADLCVCKMLNEVTTPRLVDFNKGIVAAIDPRHPTQGIKLYRQHFTDG